MKRVDNLLVLVDSVLRTVCNTTFSLYEYHIVSYPSAASLSTDASHCCLQTALGFMRGWAPRTTLALANAVGAATATRAGAGRNVATKFATETILAAGASHSSPHFSAACQVALELL
jgi:hypothetical protein